MSGQGSEGGPATHGEQPEEPMLRLLGPTKDRSRKDDIPAQKKPSSWTREYGERHKPVKFTAPGHPDGRWGRVTVYRRGPGFAVRYRPERGAKPKWEKVEPAPGEDLVDTAIAMANSIDSKIALARGTPLSFKPSTLREACESRRAADEASQTCRGPTLVKYAQLDAHVLLYAEGTPEGQRCARIHEIDTTWCEDFNRHLDSLRTTANGGTVTEKNPRRLLSEKHKRDIRRRLGTVIDHAITRTPPFVPAGFRNSMTRKLVGPDTRNKGVELSEPPVALDQLVAIVPVLDVYGLGLLVLLFLYGLRPSEFGRILAADFDAVNSFMVMIGRPATGYWTKGSIDKAFPVTAAAAACLKPFLVPGVAPIFLKRRLFEGKIKPVLPKADEAMIAERFEELQADEAKRLRRGLKKKELADLSLCAWADAGAVTGRDVARELQMAAKKAGLERIPKPKDVRHLFESLCEEARLSDGVIRFLMGHAPERRDSLPYYNHTGRRVIREQVALLDERRAPLIQALLDRAAELDGQRS